jgi:histidinol-phosphate phosphatase family protein
MEIERKFLGRNKTIILDRDGVINKKAIGSGYITKLTEWEWLNGSKEAIVLLKKSGYQVIVVTNQACIAKGLMTIEDLEILHLKMQQDLKECGVEIDKIYFCPHASDANCDCRKPKPGLLFQAQNDFNLNLSEVYFVGDHERDILAGKAAGSMTFLINEGFSLLDFVKRELIKADDQYNPM